MRTAPAAQVLIYQLGASALMFVLAALVFGEALLVPVSRLVIWSVLYQGVWVAAITFLIWFALIARYPATGLSVITFMTPVFGALLGYWFLDESLGPRHLFSVSAVAVGIALVTRKKNARQPTET